MNKASALKIFGLVLLLAVLAVVPKAWANCNANLSWWPNAESDHAGYVIHYGTTAGGPYPHPIKVGNPGASPETGRVHVVVTGLTCSETYYLVATAYGNDGNESEYSIEVKFTPGLEVSVPAVRRLLIR